MLFENHPPAGAGLAVLSRDGVPINCFRVVDDTPFLTYLTADEYLRGSKRKVSHREKLHIHTCLKCPRMNWIFTSANKWGQLLKKRRPPPSCSGSVAAPLGPVSGQRGASLWFKQGHVWKQHGSALHAEKGTPWPLLFLVT